MDKQTNKHGRGIKLHKVFDVVFEVLSKVVVFQGTADLGSVSVFILCFLCRGSYVATRLLLAATSHSDRQDLFSASSIDPGTKVAAECLCYHLSRVNLAEAIPHAAKVKEYLPKIMDAFCAAYREDDLAPWPRRLLSQTSCRIYARMTSMWRSFLSKIACHG